MYFSMRPSKPDIVAWITSRLADRLNCPIEAIDTHVPFAHYGLGSADALGLVGELETWLNRPLSPTLLYDYSTISTLAAYLTEKPPEAPSSPHSSGTATAPIAIVGMACRFPGASSLAAYWKLLLSGTDAIQRVPTDRWDVNALDATEKIKPGTAQTQWGGFLEHVDLFDPKFFRIAPREANQMDPQQRLLLEVAWEAIEDAGILPAHLAGTPTGVFVGISTHDYSSVLDPSHNLTDAYSGTGNALSIAANRLSYVLNLNGPSLAVDTACSSSLVALHLACQSLRNGEAAQALVGGVNVILDPKVTINFSKAGFLAPDGRCKAFDAHADGYVRGEGAGMVMLKPLAQAQADGDRIYAVLRGSAINQDGQTNGLTAPSQRAQEAVLHTAYSRAHIDQQTVDYIEMHGTGTALGDRIEAHALGTAFPARSTSEGPYRIGSVKTNIGHLEAAAGIASLIKVALALHHETLPASLHFQNPNPIIDFEALHVKVQDQTMPWPIRETPRRAGISAFGFGGTNAHVVLQEAPRLEPSVQTENLYMLPLSGHTRQALEEQSILYAAFLRANTTALGDIAFTASARRMHHPHRLAVLCSDQKTAHDALQAYTQGHTHPNLITPSKTLSKRDVVFVFSGQGTHWAQMGQALWQAEPIFREALELCDDVLSQYVTWSLFEELEADAATTRLDDTTIAQPVLCAFQIALAALLRSWGITPDAVVGHSIGELAAAHSAGVFDLETTLRLAVVRGQSMQSLTPGSMAAVGLSEATLAPYIKNGLSIAALNGPETTIISGAPAHVDAFSTRLHTEGIAVHRLDTRYAFHSQQMEHLQTAFGQALGDLSPNPEIIPFYSTLAGTQCPGPDLDTTYWQRQLRETVRFEPAVRALLNAGFTTFIELGPHPVLQTHIRAISQAVECPSLALSTCQRNGAPRAALLKTVAHLYAMGHTLNWEAVSHQGVIVSLPPYAWQRQRYWVDTPSFKARPLSHLASRSGFQGNTIQSPFTLQGHLWETTLSLDTHTYLRDHQIEDTYVFPAAGFVALVHAAAQHIYARSPKCYADLTFVQPLFLEEASSYTLQVHFDTPSADAFAFRVVYPVTSDKPLLTGHLRFESSDLQTHTPFHPTTSELLYSQDTLYARFAEHGLHYGETFQEIKELNQTPKGIQAHLRTPSDQATPLWPPVLDSCFQTIGAALSAIYPEGAYIPHHLARLTIHTEAQTGAVVYAQTTSASPDRSSSRTGEAWLWDAQESPVLTLEGLTLYPLRNIDSLVNELEFLYTLRWDSQSRPSETSDSQPGLWLLVGPDSPMRSQVQEALHAQGHTSWLVDTGNAFSQDGTQYIIRPHILTDLDSVFQAAQTHPLPCVGVVVLSAKQSTSDTRGRTVMDFTHLVQALLQRGWRDAPRLWVVTEQATSAGETPPTPNQAMLWGFCRSLRHEHPELQCTTVDLSRLNDPSEAEALTQELLGSTHEDQLAFRGSARYVARLAPLVQKETTVALTETSIEAPLRLMPPASGILDQLTWHPYEHPSLDAHTVSIRVEASGLNFRDVLKALHQYPGQNAASNWLGDECAGTVVGIGAEVTSVAVGDAVLALAPHSFSRYVTVAETQVIKKPTALSFAEAAALPVAYLTAYYALDYLARLRSGERVLIHSAAGGVGQAAVRWAQHIGAKIFATAGTPEKRAWLESQGIDHVFDSRSTVFADDINAVTHGEGVDVVLNALPGDLFTASLGLLRSHGRFVELGKQTSVTGMPILDANRAFFTLDLEALVRERPAVMQSLLQDLLQHIAIDHIPALPAVSFSIREVEHAFRHMAQAKHQGKIAIVWDAETLPVPVPRHEQLLFKADAWYLITGGRGALGLATAAWMIEHGARHLILASRTPVSSELEAQLDMLRQAGATLRTPSLDVGDDEAVATLMNTLRDETYPLCGIIHAAGILDDSSIVRLQPDQVEHVLAPKVDGAWHLHTHTQDLPLDFFVLYASAAALVGSPGQAVYAAANAFLDALAHYRHQQGLPATSMLWGPWDQMGFTASPQKPQHASLRGLERLNPNQAFDALAYALRHQEPSVMAVPLNMRHWQNLYPQAAAWPVFEKLTDAPAVARRLKKARETTLATLATLATDKDRIVWIEEQLRQHIAHVLQWPAEELESHTSLNDLGFDSLMAIELRNRLETHFGIFLPATFVWNGPAHINDLARHVAQDLGIIQTPSSTPRTVARPSDETTADHARVAALEQLSDDEVEALLLAKLADIEDHYDA